MLQTGSSATTLKSRELLFLETMPLTIDDEPLLDVPLERLGGRRAGGCREVRRCVGPLSPCADGGCGTRAVAARADPYRAVVEPGANRVSLDHIDASAGRDHSAEGTHDEQPDRDEEPADP